MRLQRSLSLFAIYTIPSFQIQNVLGAHGKVVIEPDNMLRLVMVSREASTQNGVRQLEVGVKAFRTGITLNGQHWRF